VICLREIFLLDFRVNLNVFLLPKSDPKAVPIENIPPAFNGLPTTDNDYNIIVCDFNNFYVDWKIIP